MGSYIRSLDKRLSIPKHTRRRSSACSQEDSPSMSRNYNIQVSQPSVDDRVIVETMESPRLPIDPKSGEFKPAAIKLGQDILNPEFQRQRKRTTTALNAIIADSSKVDPL